MKKHQPISIINLRTLLDIKKQNASEKGRIFRLDAAMVWDAIPRVLKGINVKGPL
jgi:hypothetical protein